MTEPITPENDVVGEIGVETEHGTWIDPMEQGLAKLEAPAPPAALLDRCLETIPPPPQRRPDAHERKKSMGFILAVDDEPNIVRLMQVNLERQGYEVETAFTGAEALRKIRTRRPDLLVSDVMMPEMDGFELLSTIRRDPVLADLRVIMLTAKAQDGNIMEGYARGADMYLTKPFNPQELLQFVKRLMATDQDRDEGRIRIS